MDRPNYRDAKTHLKTEASDKNANGEILNVLNSSYNVEKKREIANFRLYFNETSSGNGRDSRKRDGD